MSGASEPVWLKIMEHGATGEARTKAFLLDRFWVMERSVDVDGADFLIQLRLLSTRFTDASPPRVGIVQAKYYQGRATTQYIPSHYVIDDKGESLKGVFAVLHVGQEDALDKISKRSAFLALSGRIREELIAKVTEMFDEAEKDQRYLALLSFDAKTLALERVKVKRFKRWRASAKATVSRVATRRLPVRQDQAARA